SAIRLNRLSRHRFPGCGRFGQTRFVAARNPSASHVRESTTALQKIVSILAARFDVFADNPSKRWATREEIMKRFAIVAALMASTSLASAPLASAQEISDGVVRIGVLNDQTGTYADFGGLTSAEAARMAVEDFGAEEKGIKVEIISADHQNKADVASALARRWIDVDGVDAIADLTNSAVAIAVNTIGKETGTVTLMTGPATTRLTNEDCSPTGFHWVFDTYSQSVGTAKSVLEQGKDTWFLLTADYAFGHQMAAEITRVVEEGGGKIAGSVNHPLGSADFSSFLVQAQASGAQIVGLANAGTDTINAIKQAGEFGIAQGGQNLAALVIVISDVH